MLNKLLATYVAEKDGATAIEYGLLAAGISVVIVALVFTLGEEIQAAFQAIVDEMQG